MRRSTMSDDRAMLTHVYVCPDCSAPVEHTHLFCPSCGTGLAEFWLEPSDASESARLQARARVKRSDRRFALLILALLVVMVGGGVWVLASRDDTGSATTHEPDSGTPIAEAAESCGVETNVGDEGTSITFDTEGEEDFEGDDFSDATCVLMLLDTPDRVVAQIGQTRALDGMMETSWGDYKAFWNYHPDSGMNLTVYEAE